MQQIFIDGAWSEAHGAPARTLLNPATLKPLGAAADCGAGGSFACRRGGAPRITRMDGYSRRASAARCWSKSALASARKKAELANLLTRESGKPLCESRDCIDASALIFERASAVAPPDDQSPGVVAVLVPFNFPLLMMAAAIAPAIAAGNTVVCKPASENPLASLMLARAFERLPAGVVNVFTGTSETGLALRRHPGVMTVDLEPGSVDAFIVCKDVDLDVAVPAIAWARLMNGGQGCGFGGHVYVEQSIAADFVDRMHPCVGFLDVDDPAKPPTDLGPLISLDAAHRVEDQVGRTLRSGAKLILGGRRFRPSGLPGHFFQPTILTNVRPGSVPTRERILGPVITVTPAADLTEAFAMHSAEGRSGFGASIFTADPERAITSLDAIRGGDVRINDPESRELSGPFAGMRCARLRAALGGVGGLQVAPVLVPKPWWFPYRERN